MVFLFVMSIIVAIGSICGVFATLFWIDEEDIDRNHGIALIIGLVVLIAFAIQCGVWIFTGAGWDTE